MCVMDGSLMPSAGWYKIKSNWIYSKCILPYSASASQPLAHISADRINPTLENTLRGTSIPCLGQSARQNAVETQLRSHRIKEWHSHCSDLFQRKSPKESKRTSNGHRSSLNWHHVYVPATTGSVRTGHRKQDGVDIRSRRQYNIREACKLPVKL